MKQRNKGVAGLTILLSVIVMLFIIGLIVTIFSIMAGKMADTDSLYQRTGAIAVKGELITPITAGNSTTAMYQTYYLGKRSAQCAIVAVYNGTGGLPITATNYTEISECILANTSASFRTVPWAVNYTYTYLADEHGSVGVINDTSTSIASVTDWYDILIVISAMVVLILLTVLIISAIRGSGMIGSGNNATAPSAKVGTA